MGRQLKAFDTRIGEVPPGFGSVPACDTTLRDTFNWWETCALERIDEPSRATWMAALERGRRPHRALRTIGARWARILWRCWQDRTTSGPTRNAATRT